MSERSSRAAGGERRVEHDGLGEVEVPATALYGAETARALLNTLDVGPRVSDRPELIRALGEVKAAAAAANLDVRALDPVVGDAIVRAAREVAANGWDDEFPLALVQGGGGTSTNMCANEVVANRAGELLGEPRGTYRRVDPHDHVNLSQSTNDVYPTALQIAVVRSGSRAVDALSGLAASFERKAAQLAGLERLGRTCLQDALPVPVDGVHLAQATAIERLAHALQRALDALLTVPLGGTAVGTGAGAAPGYRDVVVGLLAVETGLPLKRSEDTLDALAHFDGYLEVASALAGAMVLVGKIAADFRFLSSGPVGGVRELRLPPVQVGSSCMPTKINPVIPELVLQVAMEVRGARSVVEHAVAAGELELNVMEPVIASQLLTSLDSAAAVAALFEQRCVDGMEWDRVAVDANLAGSLAGAVAVARATEGYDAIAGSTTEGSTT